MQCLLLLGAVATASPDRKAVVQTFRNLSSRYGQIIRVKKGARAPESFVYGNALYGYYQTKDFQVAGERILISLVPPGYRQPIHLYRARLDGKLSFVGDYSFRNPTPSVLAPPSITESKGDLHPRYFMMDAPLRLFPNSHHEENKDFMAVVIVNRVGEIVWAHSVSNIPSDPVHQYFQPLSPGRFAIVSNNDEGQELEVMDYRGNRIARHEKKMEGERWHHGLAWLGGEKLAMLTENRKFVSALGWLLFPKEQYYFDSIDVLDWTTGQSQRLWNSFDWMSPLIQGWQREDFLHSNHLSWVPPRGLMVVSKYAHQLSMIDSHSGKTLWTVGGGGRNRYRVQDEVGSFRNPHWAVVLPGDHWLVLDNRSKEPGLCSRLMELKLSGSEAEIVRIIVPNEPCPQSHRHGSLALLGGSIFGFFPDLESKNHYLMEFDRESGQEMARWKFSWSIPFLTYRVIPLNSLGLEEEFVPPMGALG